MDFVTNPIDGTRIAYRSHARDSGAGAVDSDGSPIVLVHGTALSQVIWRGFGYVRQLSKDRPVITLDLRGHGRSDKPPEEAAYGMDLFIADVLAVLDHLEVERAHYLGYSLGGRVGFSLADARPERVLSLISVAGAPGTQPGAFDRVFFPSCIATLDAGGMTGFLDTWQQHAGTPVDPATRAAFKANDATALAAYMRRSEQDPGVADDRLTALRPPILLLVGSEDVERRKAAEHVASASATAELQVIEGAGHGDVLRRPEVLLAIDAFLDRIDRPSRR